MAQLTPDAMFSQFTDFNMTGFNAIGGWVAKITIALLILGAIIFVYIYLSYKIKVVYYPIQGDPANKESWVLGQPKKDKARVIKKKGIEQLSLFWCRQKFKNIDYKYIYPDGLYLLRLSKKEFVPIQRPQFNNNLDGVIINPVDIDLEMWSNLQYEDLRKRFVDDDAQRKQMMMTVSVIVGLMILTGIVIWMNIAYNRAALSQTNDIVAALNNVGARIGIN